MIVIWLKNIASLKMRPTSNIYVIIVQKERNWNSQLVTSTSTGNTRTSFWSLLVRIRMNAVWFISARPMKLARITGFVSKGGISCKERYILENILQLVFFQFIFYNFNIPCNLPKNFWALLFRLWGVQDVNLPH